MEQGETQFVPFPAHVTERVEAASRAAQTAGKVYNPNHPDPAKRGTPPQTRQVAQPMPRMAAQGMQLAAPGTPVPAPAAQATPRMQRNQAQQKPLVPQQAIDAYNAHVAAQAPVDHGPSTRTPYAATAMSAPVAYQEHNNEFDFNVQANSEHEAVSFALPSHFHYYEFKDLYIKPFRGRNFSKLNRAKEEESMLHVVEAVSSVIHNSMYPQGLAFELTLPDFYACLYWLRLNSFLKHGFVHKTMCRAVVHHNQVNAGTLDKDTLRHAENITRATLVTKELVKPLDPAQYALDSDAIYLVPATMRDVLDITMNENIDQYDARIASSFQFVAGKASLAERMAFIDNLSADDIATITKWENDVNDYGVQESIKWKCRTCGHVHTDELELEAHSFFPSAA
jgi:hypothetical protein